MPRSKNPNPRQLSNKKSSDDNDSSSDNKHSNGTSSSCDVVPSPDPSDKCESTSAAKAIDKRPFMQSILTQEKLSIKAPITKTSTSTFFIDLTRKREEEEKNNNNNSSSLQCVLVDDALSEERPISPNNNFLNEWKGPRFGVSKPKTITKYEEGDTPNRCNMKQADLYVWDWVRKNLTLHPGSRLSASEVLSTYEADQEKLTHYDTSNVDLRASCHKVGMLVRRMFPDIQRCKITVSGKRVWVYKNLALRRDIEDLPADDEATLADTLTPSYYKSLWNSNSLSNSLVLQRNSVYDRISKQNSVGKSSTSASAASLHHQQQQPSPTSHHHSTTTVANKACNITTSASSNNTADITQWLSENYEYSDGSCVRSSDVLEQYNRIHNSQVRYLSHIGRIIRIVFPEARHIRRSCQGGKREWLYQNIRPCEQLLESYSSVGKSLIRKPEDGPIKHSSKAKSSSTTGGGMMFLQLQSVMKNNSNNGGMIKKESHQQQQNDNNEPTATIAAAPSLTRCTFLGKPIVSMKRRYSASFTPPTHDMNGGGESAAAAASRIAVTSAVVLANSVINTNAVTPSKRSRSTTVEVICSNDSGDKSELSSPASTANHDEMTFSPGSPSTRFSQSFSEGDAAETPQRVDEDDEAVADGFEHNPYTRGLVDGDLRVRGEFKKSDDDKVVIDDDEVDHMNGKINNDGDDVEPADPHFEWKLLKTIPSEQFGWSRLPVSGGRRSADNQLYEWVRFEGHLVCDGKRVLRELIIKNNFSVKVFALNRCVITPVGDLVRNYLRTRCGIMKIFKALSEMRLCRGLAAFQFSEVTAHSQVIATTEIWSSRVHPQETLRHRSVNCQFLFTDKKDARSETCPKCLHLFKVTGLGGGSPRRTATPPPPPQSPKQSPNPPPPQPSINNNNNTTTSPTTSTTTNATAINNDDTTASPCDGNDNVQS